MFPSSENPGELQTFAPVEKLFDVQYASRMWSRKMGIHSVGDLNELIASGNMMNIVLMQEALQEKIIGDIAEKIESKKSVKIVLIAGPSSSGKTSSNQRLCVQMEVNGLHPIPLSMDNYYVNREDTPKNPDGTYDFERVEVIDTVLFNNHLKRLMNGDTVELPYFNFKTGHREYRGETICGQENSIFVIEGIHALNPKVTASIPDENKLKIFVSALTPMSLDAYNRIHTTDLRMLRRMVRDARFRSHDALGTIKMWPSVRLGEEKYIFPCQEDADIFFNTSLIYEPAVLRKFAVPLLQNVPKKEKAAYLTARRLLRLLRLIEPLDEEAVPNNSILKEFIGGSAFAREL